MGASSFRILRMAALRTGSVPPPPTPQCRPKPSNGNPGKPCPSRLPTLARPRPFTVLSDLLPVQVSILIPVYNERTVVERSLSRVLAAPLPEDVERELIVVDDCSTDGTPAILERLAAGDARIRLFRHTVNQGKGAGLRTAIAQAQGDFCLVQDADLEYDPEE